MLLVLASCGSDPTPMDKAKYEQIRNGMTYDEVEKIVTWPGAEVGRGNVGGIETVTYIWRNPDGANMTALFLKERLMTKAEVGLK